jgi:hypothetical protein
MFGIYHLKSHFVHETPDMVAADEDVFVLEVSPDTA